MNDGKLVLNFEEGNIISASVGSGLYESFRRLFDDAEADLNRKHEPDVDLAVRLVVFGCMWIEALCNEYLPALLRNSELPDGVPSAVWSALERTSTLQKLKILAEFDADGEAQTDWVAPLGPLFQLRNGLVHFKDRYVEVSGPMTIEEFEKKLAVFPEGELTAKLKTTASENARAVRAAVQRLEQIVRQHLPAQTIKLAEPGSRGK